MKEVWQYMDEIINKKSNRLPLKMFNKVKRFVKKNP